MKFKNYKYGCYFLFCLCLVTGKLTAQLSQLKSITVYFEFNSDSLDAIAINKIDSVFTNPKKVGMKIESIEAHCDSLGSMSYNDSLSDRRALTVKNYVCQKYFCESTLTVNSFGKRKLLNENKNESQRALNRCVTIFYNEGVTAGSSLMHNKESGTQTDSTPNEIKNDLDKFDFEKSEIGSNFILKNLSFHPGRHLLMKSSSATLDSLIVLLKKYPSLEIEIQGYVCCLPYGDGIDLDLGTSNLSVNRAKTVYDFLIKGGIAKSRLKYKGYGAKNKIADESTEEGMQQNRRVEIKIIKK
jgi:outer membrane protein OmpA-like peptidoglycan-associated protein